MYWDIGEAAVTIFAASIPILRVLFVTMISESHQTSNEGVRVATQGSMFSQHPGFKATRNYELSSATLILRPQGAAGQVGSHDDLP
jgi:hypothetical protein